MADYRISVDVDIDGQSKLDALEKQIKNIQNTKSINIKLNIDGAEALASISKTLNSISKSTKSATVKVPVDFDIKRNTLNSQINKALTQVKKLGSNADIDIKMSDGSVRTITQMAYSLEAMQREFNAIADAKGPEEAAAKMKDLERATKQVSSAVKSVQTGFNLDQVNADLDRNRKKVEQTIETWRKLNTAAERSYGSTMDSFMSRLSSATTDKQIKDVSADFTTMQRSAKAAGATGLSFWDGVVNKVKEYGQYLTVAGAAAQGVFLVQDMFKNVLEVDTAMTGLYRVTDLTSSQYTQLYDNMIASAKEYGATLTDIINATADWTRAGFDADTSNALAEVTTMYQHIADLDYDTAAENLLTAYNGFKDSLSGQFGDDVVGTVSYITDVLNELDNKYSVTAAGLGEALQRSASAMQLAGNTFQETAAMTTGMTEVIQDPAKSGQALKILSLRLRGMKGELQEMGEEVDPTVENISKMQGQILNLTHGKVDIFDDGEFKSTYEIMDGIHSAWEDMSDIEQAEVCLYVQKCA